MSELFLVRHAQASFGKADYDQLSELGVNQSRWLGEYFKRQGIEFTKLIVGDMRRHHQTLDSICEAMGTRDQDRTVIAGLNEYDFAELTAAYAESFPDDSLLQKVKNSPLDKKNHYRLLRVALSAWARNEITNVNESWEAFFDRVQKVRRYILAGAKSGQRVLAIGSGGSNSTFLGQVLDAPPETIFDLNLQSRNTGISSYFFNEKKITLSCFNMVPHLDTNELRAHVTY